MANWQSRIVERAEIDPRAITPNPLNWRTHPSNQADALRDVLDRVGWVQDVILNKRTGHLVDGHLRVDLAIKNDEPRIPVVFVDLDEDEEALILATYDPLSALASTDREQLSALLEKVEVDSPQLEALLTQIAAKVGLGEPTDPYAEWQGLPQYEQVDQFGIQMIKVRFMTREDVDAFAKLIGQPITPETKYLWYPAQAPVKAAHLAYVQTLEDAAS